MTVSVCVCEFVSPQAYLWKCPCVRSLPNFLCILHMAVAQSSSGGIVIRYVLPVLCMTSYLHNKLT